MCHLFGSGGVLGEISLFAGPFSSSNPCLLHDMRPSHALMARLGCYALGALKGKSRHVFVL